VTYRRQKLLKGEGVDILRQSFHEAIGQKPFKIDAIVVLPDHLHCIWQLPPGDDDYSLRWKKIKTYFTKQYKHFDYIHYNPVKHGLAKAPKDWEYSSFHRWVRDGIYELEWAAGRDVTFDEKVGKE